jgi:hypothetical protein
MFKQKETLIILWMTFVTVVAWVSLNIYHIWVTSTISNIDAASILPIDPKFDTNIIDKLKTREIVEPLYQFNVTSQENAASQEAQAQVTIEP